MQGRGKDMREERNPMRRCEVKWDRGCAKCDETSFFIGWAKTVSGSTIFPLVCAACGEVSTRYVKRIDAERAHAEGLDVPMVETRTMSRFHGANVCEACKLETGTEVHHWAPRHLFGDEADAWPTANLCVECHKRWHALVTPNMSRKKNDDS